jgi:hypothetical protein
MFITFPFPFSLPLCFYPSIYLAEIFHLLLVTVCSYIQVFKLVVSSVINTALEVNFIRAFNSRADVIYSFINILNLIEDP